MPRNFIIYFRQNETRSQTHERIFYTPKILINYIISDVLSAGTMVGVVPVDTDNFGSNAGEEDTLTVDLKGTLSEEDYC